MFVLGSFEALCEQVLTNILMSYVSITDHEYDCAPCLFCVMIMCFSTKRDEMTQMGRNSEEVKDKCLFISCKNHDQVSHIAAQGVMVKPSNFSSLGKFIISVYCYGTW